jgi:O-antigen/teichoic acid export membrane protein
MNEEVVISKFRIIINAAYNLGGSVFTFIISIATSILIARQLGPQLFGVYSTLFWLLSTLASIISFGMPNALSKFVAEYSGKGEKETRSSLISYTIVLTGFIGLIIATPLLLTRNFIGDMLSLSPEFRGYIPLIVFGAILSAGISILSSTLIGLQNFRYVALGNVIIGLASPVLALVLLLNGFGLGGVVVAYIVAYLIGLLFQVVFVRKSGIVFKHRLQITNEVQKKFLNYSLVQVGITFINLVIWERSEVFFLTRFSGLNQVAFYSLAFSLNMAVMGIALGSLAGVITPYVSFHDGKGNHVQIGISLKIGTRYMAMLSLPICALGIGLATPLIELLYGTPFIDVAVIFRILLIGGAAGAIGRIGSSIMYGTSKHNFILKAGAPLALINIILNIFLIPKWGAVGAALANTTTQLLGIIIGSIYIYKSQKVNYPALSLIRIGIAATVVAMIVWLASWLPGWIGIVTALLFGILAYVGLLFLIRELTLEDIFLLRSLIKYLTVSVWKDLQKNIV